MTNQNYTVCSVWLANSLIEHGFCCVGKGKNANKRGFDVFYFEDSEELRNEIKIQKEARRNNNAKLSKSKDNNNR